MWGKDRKRYGISREKKTGRWQNKRDIKATEQTRTGVKLRKSFQERHSTQKGDFLRGNFSLSLSKAGRWEAVGGIFCHCELAWEFYDKNSLLSPAQFLWTLCPVRVTLLFLSPADFYFVFGVLRSLQGQGGFEQFGQLDFKKWDGFTESSLTGWIFMLLVGLF